VSLRKLPQKLIQALEGAALVPAPEVLLRLMRAVEDEGVSLADIAEIVNKDPAIAARILAAANSTAFHRGRPLTAIEDCLQQLGLRVVRTIAVCLSVQCVFARQSVQARIDLSAFWYHSLLSAELARGLAQATAYPRPGEAYLGGLLHDIGELALLSALRAEYAAMLALSADGESLSALELVRLGATHADVGAWLVDQWELDSQLADGVLFHHVTHAQIAEADWLPRIVWCANAAAVAGQEAVVLGQLATLLNLPEGDLSTLHAQACDRVVQIAGAMGIDIAQVGNRTLPVAEFPPTAQTVGAADIMLESMAETAILQALQRDAYTGRGGGDMPRALCEAARLLFGVEHCAFLLYQDADNALSGKDVAGQSDIFAVMRLALQSSSMAVRALRERKAMGSHSGAELVLADMQLCRALRSEGFVSLPLVRGERMVGVMLLGASVEVQGRLLGRENWLQSFARIASLILEARTSSNPMQELSSALGREQQIRRFSHEIGNPLSIIKSYLRLLEHRLPEEDAAMREELGVLKEEIDRVVRIVRQLSDTSSTEPGSSIAVNGVVSNLLSLYGESLFESRGIALQLSLDPRDPVAQGDPDGFKQVLLNLLKNASEALDEGASVRVETSATMVHEGVRYSGFTVQDTGPGIPLALVERLYAPMTEAYPAPGARGMGLSIIGGLVKHMNGKVVCETRQGEGSRISILLPAKEAKLGGAAHG